MLIKPKTVIICIGVHAILFISSIVGLIYLDKPDPMIDINREIESCVWMRGLPSISKVDSVFKIDCKPGYISE